MSFFEVDNLSVSYGHISALRDVSVRVEEGMIVSIIGSNGAGKSTLMNAISGVVKRESGTLCLEGKALPGATGNYTASLEARGIRPEKIRCYGFAFEGKKY